MKEAKGPSGQHFNIPNFSSTTLQRWDDCNAKLSHFKCSFFLIFDATRLQEQKNHIPFHSIDLLLSTLELNSNEHRFRLIVNRGKEIFSFRTSSGGQWTSWKISIEIAINKAKAIQFKVLIVGKANVGKTALLKRLTGKWRKLDSFVSAVRGKAERVQTDGIEIHLWQPLYEYPSSIVWFYDFAGQETYYTTHQLFLSEGAINMIVFAMNEPIEPNQVRFWLNSIHARAPSSRVMFIGSFSDKIKEKELSEVEQSISKELRRLFDQWASLVPKEEQLKVQCCQLGKSDALFFWPISSTKNKGIPEVSYFLKELARSQLREVSPEFRQLIHHIREQCVAYKAKGEAALISKRTIDQWITNCFEIGKAAGGLQTTSMILKDLHEWGIVIDFSTMLHEDACIVIDPQWLSDVFRSVITVDEEGKEGKSTEKTGTVSLPTQAGIIGIRVLEQRWSSFGQGKAVFESILQVLQSFDICAPHPHEPSLYIIPSLLSETRPNDLSIIWKTKVNEKAVIGRSYHPGFLPFGLFSRLMIQVSKRISPATSFWRNGIMMICREDAMLLECIDEASGEGRPTMKKISTAASTVSTTTTTTTITTEEGINPSVDFKIRLLTCGPTCSDLLARVDALIMEYFLKWYPNIHRQIKREIHFKPALSSLPSSIDQQQHQLDETSMITISFDEAITKWKRDEDLYSGLVYLPAEILFPEGGKRVATRNDNNNNTGNNNSEIEKMQSEEQEQQLHDSNFPLKLKMSDIREGKILDQGTFGVVSSCSIVQCKGRFAMKVIKIQPSATDIERENMLATFTAEVETLSKLKRHPNIVQLIGWCCDADQCVAVMDLYDSSLSKVLRERHEKHKKFGSDLFTITEMKGFCQQILNGLSFLHCNGIAHRDMKVCIEII